jgi:phosphotransferase system enzyme I (PtsI)
MDVIILPIVHKAYGYLTIMKIDQKTNDSTLHRDFETEIALFHSAINDLKQEIESLLNNLNSLPIPLTEILTFYVTVLNDSYMIEAIDDWISHAKLTAEAAIRTYFDDFIAQIEQKNDYFKARKDDIEDIKNRLIAKLLNPSGVSQTSLKPFDRPTILFFDSIYPYQLASMNLSFVSGVISHQGSLHSHAAIILESLKIPYGIMTPDQSIEEGTFVEIDFENNSVMRVEAADNISDLKNEAILKTPKTISNQIKLMPAMNVMMELPEKIPDFLHGIGLYRTEFLFFNSHRLPDEIEQYLNYRKITDRFSRKRVNFRLIDVEIDKPLPSYTKKIYGIDFLLQNQKIVKTQLKALLELSLSTPIGIIIPMVRHQDDVEIILQIIDSVKASMGIDLNYDYQIGIMIERFEAIANIESFEKLGFMMLGTNDLASTYAKIKRDNHHFILESYLHPDMVRAAFLVIRHCEAFKMDLYLCGDAANHPITIQLFSLLGIKVFSPSMNKLHLYQDLSSENFVFHNDLIRSILKAETSLSIQKTLELFERQTKK